MVMAYEGLPLLCYENQKSNQKCSSDIINQQHLVSGNRFHLARMDGLNEWRPGLPYILHFYILHLHVFTFVLVCSLLIIQALFRFMLHYIYIANSFGFSIKLCLFICFPTILCVWNCFFTHPPNFWHYEPVWFKCLEIKYSVSLWCFCLLSLRIA